MIWPFIIFALPRSRTTWLSSWLSYSGLTVGHDLGPRADSVQGFLDSLWPLAGSAETGAQDAHRLLRRAMPESKFVVVKRPVDEVAASLAKFGLHEPDLERRDAVLDEIIADGALAIRYQDLRDVRVCAYLWEHLYPDLPFDFIWWRAFDQHNIQVNLVEEVAMLNARRDKIEALKQEIRTSTADFLRIGWEPVDSWLADSEEMTATHFREVNNGERHGHPFKFDVPALRQMEQAGCLRVLTARINGKLVGYLTWSFLPDTESEGIMVADQGAWYADPSAPGVGKKMLDFSIAELRKAGIHSVQLHHQLNGRGAKLGLLFKRMGAIEHQHRYTLWIGD